MDVKKGFYCCDELDELHTMRDMLNYAKVKYGSKIAYHQIENASYESAITFRGLADNVDYLGTALMEHELQGKHIALIGETSMEWITCYLAVLNGVGVVLPLDSALNAESIAKQIRFGDAEAVICSKKLYKTVSKAVQSCPKIKTVILIRATEEFDFPTVETQLNYYRLLDEGKKLLRAGDRRFLDAPIDPEKLSQLVFTSGTTGANKGVMLCHKNICTTLQGARRLVGYLNSSMSVLPANHTYELTCHIGAGIIEGTTIYINDDLRHVAKNISHFSPDMLCMVPMMVNSIVRKIKLESEKANLTKHLSYGITVSNLLRKVGIDKRAHYFEPITKNFGGNLKKIICGGAPLEQDVVDFLDNIGITVLNGYGITECAPLVAVNGDMLWKKNSVGHVLPNCEVRIDQPDENGNGEIQVKGGNVMLGYYKMPEDTACVFTEDGWFKTGDIGSLDNQGFLFINGRVKNLIILSNGKNIYPEELETAIEKEIPYVKESIVHTDSEGTGIYAICYLDEDYCSEHRLNTDEDKYRQLMDDIKSYNKKMPTFKRIADVRLSMKEFEKTSTKKIRRFKVLERSEEYVRESKEYTFGVR